MAFQNPGDGSLDYYPCRYGTSRLLFRGPRRDVTRPYLAVLGGSETYGKFVANPYPALIEAIAGVRVVNLGLVNAGVDAFLKDNAVQDLLVNAQMTVMQITGAQNLTNRYYSVHPRRNDRFVTASPLLRSMFREVDFTDFHFTRHLVRHLQTRSADRFEVVAEELRATWVRQMRALLRAVKGRAILLWVAQQAPPAPSRRADLESEPLIVDAEMIAAIRPLAADFVQVLPSAEARALGTQGMVLGPMDAPVAAALPNPAVHQEIASLVAACLARHV
ncbi:DUF6473 family protein [Pseudotabrizicola sp. L79]|uniref:DUF6473 family protein n=1 Tax=Pseudotabrizicola sp. L79 TaxID=3118402 RepID=UPI002F921EA6